MRGLILRAAASVVLAAVALVPFTVAAPAGDTILVLRNAADPARSEVRLTEADLLAMPQVTVRTRTEWTDGVAEYVGPLARDVVARIGAGPATTAHLVAANDYSVDVPIGDFTEYDVIFAMQADGKRLTLRDKGPLWVMYPIDDHAELNDPTYNLRMIWQLTTVELR